MKLALSLLALKATDLGQDRLDETMCEEVLETAGPSEPLYAWREVQEAIRKEKFWLMRPLDLYRLIDLKGFWVILGGAENAGAPGMSS